MNNKYQATSEIKQSKTIQHSCRFCGKELQHIFVDLGMSPLCESYVELSQLNQMEPFYPLRVYVCQNCYLVQLEEYVKAEDIFSEYAYFSSYSDSWLKHAHDYTSMIVDRLKLGKSNLVIEIASNDGYLLQYFIEKGIPTLGIEPAINVAKVALQKGIPTRMEFFGLESARKLKSEGYSPDLIVGNNVLAQVPDLNDFVAGLKELLNPQGVITIEFPHLMRLMVENQFDTIYHEHFSYFSLITAEKIFSAHDLLLFDVEEIPTHGGSLRIYACHREDRLKNISERLVTLRVSEENAGFKHLEHYTHFADQVKETKRNLLELLIKLKYEKKKIAGYGAPGKGNTLLNYCGIREDFLEFTVDRNPYKQGKFLPGTHIPIYAPGKIYETRPDFLLILPWNFKDEIMQQMAFIRDWDGQFIVPIPEARIYP